MVYESKLRLALSLGSIVPALFIVCFCFIMFLSKIFHIAQGKNINYNNKEKLNDLLAIEEIDEINAATGEKKEKVEQQLKEIIDEYIETCESNTSYDFRYYYVKYHKIFKPVNYGKYDFESENYEVWVLTTPSNRSSNSYQPFLKKCQTDQNKKDDIGQKGVIALYLDENKEKYIESKKEGLLITNKNNPEKKLVRIEQENDIDKENRIELLEKVIKNPEVYW